MSIIIFMVLVLCAIAWSEIRNKRNAKASDNTTSTDDKIVEISTDVMDEAFNRSAGRYCEHCGVHGSHHSDRHNEYATFAINKRNNGGMIDLSSIVKVK